MPKTEEMLKLRTLEIENFMRVRAATLTMGDDDVLIVEGKNGQGKSSTVRALASLIGGKEAIPDDPIHGDEQSAKVIGTFGDLVVTREFAKAKAPKLVIKQEGEKRAKKAPATMLKELLGHLTLDPLAFMEMDAQEQIDTLSKLMGFDAAKYDAEYQALYDERRDLNRDLKRMQAAAESATVHEDAPEEEVSVKDLMAELEKRRAHNVIGTTARQTVEDLCTAISDYDSEIAEQEAILAQLMKDRAKAESEKCDAVHLLESWRPANESEISDQIANADAINAKVRDNANALKLGDEANVQEQKVADVQAKMDALESEKEAAIMEARKRLPIPELSITKDAVLYNGKPLSQAGSSASVKASAAVAMALNQDKRIRILLIDDAEKLDEDNTRLLIETARDNGYQVFMARVGSGEAGVLIEDGVSQ